MNKNARFWRARARTVFGHGSFLPDLGGAPARNLRHPTHPKRRNQDERNPRLNIGEADKLRQALWVLCERGGEEQAARMIESALRDFGRTSD